MKRSNQPWRPLTGAQINWRGEHTPHSTVFDDIYYSAHDGLNESSYTFLHGNRLPRRWAGHARPVFAIVETGFGTGLNFLLTWQSWRRQANPKPRLHFLSVEKYPLAKHHLEQALAHWPSLESLAGELLGNYPDPVPGQHRIVLDDGGVILDLWWEDAADALADLASYQRRLVDCWYLDGFAPGKNPAMWSRQIFSAMASLSRKGASFATFTAAGEVRRSLVAAGFEVEKHPGFGQKRECLRGFFRADPQLEAQAQRETPWDISSSTTPKVRSVLVIGGGIAGCTTAASLVRRGLSVHLIERGELAAEASGNDQGVLYTRLSLQHSPLGDFSVQSFLFASRFYRALLSSGALVEGVDGALCGSFHQHDAAASMSEILANVPGLAQVVSASQANSLLGVNQPRPGLWYPASGWIHPGAVCRALVKHPAIDVKCNTGPVQLEPLADGWGAFAGEKLIARADCAVVAGGNHSTTLAGLHWLPLQAIRGQTTSIQSREGLAALQAVLCHSGYISPARRGEHCIGATFDTRDPDDAVRHCDHLKNIEALARAVPDWRRVLNDIQQAPLAGKVGYRCATPDYLPLVGPVPDRSKFLQNYGSLRKNARQTIDISGAFVPGLYVSTGHGSRGLTSAPLAAEILASLVCNETLPLSRELYRAISPARFIIRDLKRKKI